MAFHEVVFACHLDDEGLARGHVQRGGEPVESCQHRHVPILHVAGPRESREDERLDHECRLGADDESALRDAVGDGAGHEREAEHRSELERADEPELEGGVGQLKDEPRLPHALHPGPDEGNQLPRKEQAKVSVIECAQPTWKGHRLAASLEWTSAATRGTAIARRLRSGEGGQRVRAKRRARFQEMVAVAFFLAGHGIDDEGWQFPGERLGTGEAPSLATKEVRRRQDHHPGRPGKVWRGLLTGQRSRHRRCSR